MGRILLLVDERPQPGMEELAGQLTAVPVDRLRDGRESDDLLVGPEAREVDLRVERGLVDDRPADDDQPAAALGALLVVGDGLVGEDALVGICHPGRAGRREDDPVGNRRIPDLPLREEVRIPALARRRAHRSRD